MERAVRRETLDRRDLAALLHHGQRETRVDPPAVDEDGAGAALAEVAAFLGAGQVQAIAQSVEEGRPHVDREAMLRAVHPERDGARPLGDHADAGRAERRPWTG